MGSKRPGPGTAAVEDCPHTFKEAMRQTFITGLVGLVITGLASSALFLASPPLSAQASGPDRPVAKPPLLPVFIETLDEDAQEQLEAARLFDLLQGKIAFSEYQEAVEPARKIVELSSIEYGPDALELVEPLVNLGQALEFSGNLDQATAAYLAAIELTEKHYGPVDKRLIRPHAGLGRIAQAGGEHQAAVEYFGQARYFLRRSEGLYSLQQVPILEATARSLMELGEPEMADRKQLTVLELYTREFGEDSPEMVEPLMKLGNWSGLMYLSLSPNSQAAMACMIDKRAKPEFSTPNPCLLPGQRDLYRMAIDIIEKHYGENDPRLIEPLRALANSYYLMAVRWVRRVDSTGSAFTAGTASYYYEPVSQEGYARQALERALEILRAQADYDQREERQILVDLGDWHLAFRHNIKIGLDYYREAWRLIAAGDGGPEEANLAFKNPEQLVARAPAMPSMHSLSMDYRPSDRQSLGQATFEFDVDEEGRTRNVQILEENLDDPQARARRAMRALERTRFRPRLVDGEPVYTSHIRQNHVFTYAD